MAKSLGYVAPPSPSWPKVDGNSLSPLRSNHLIKIDALRTNELGKMADAEKEKAEKLAAAKKRGVFKEKGGKYELIY